MAAKKRLAATPGPAAARQAALARLADLLPAAELERLLAELERPLYPSLRANPLKVQPQQAILEWQQRYDWNVQPVPFCPTGWWVASASQPLSQTLEHRMGQYYLQEAASMLPVELFSFDGLEQPLCLDLAASPGGKTTHLVSRGGDRGLVLANDSSQGRIAALRLVLQSWGAVNTVVTRFPGEQFGPWYPDTFDCVLLDAPCSMQGLRTAEAHPMRPVTDKEIQSLATRQARLLESALQAARLGGQVVYSTCTLSPEEDEGVLDAVLRRHPDGFEIENLGQGLRETAPALSSYGSQVYAETVSRAARLWPHSFGTAGFFAARLRRTGPMQARSAASPQRPFEKTGFEALSRPQRAALAAEMQAAYGFDLPAVCATYGYELLQHHSGVYAVPALYLERFAGLPYQSLGLALGEEMPYGFVPSHEWVSRFEAHFSAPALVLDEPQAAAWLRGEDLHQASPPGFESGRVTLVRDTTGRLLGRARLLPERVKNLLPRRLAR